MARSRFVNALLTALFAVTLAGCWDSSPPPPVPAGEHGVFVPLFMQQGEFLCSEACIQMWEATLNFSGSPIHTQTQIYNWMHSNYPAEVDEYGASPYGIVMGAEQYLGGWFEDAIYDDPDRAMSDIHKGLQANDLTMAIVNSGFHVVLVTGSSWQTLATANYQVDYFVIQDPGRFTTWRPTIGEWRNGGAGNACGGAGCMRNIQHLGRQGIGAIALSEFYAEGGTYSGAPPAGATGRWKVAEGGCYWDQNDSGPDQCSPDSPSGRYKLDGNGNCYWDPNDSGPDQCTPELVRNINSLKRAFRTVAATFTHFVTDGAAMRGAFTDAVKPPSLSARLAARRRAHNPEPLAVHDESQYAQTTRIARRNIAVPKPWATERDDVISNFKAGITRAGMDRIPGMEKLTAPGSDWVVRDVIPVTSLGAHANYFLLHIVDRSGFIVAAGAVNDEGYLMGLEDSLGREHDRPVPLLTAEADVRGRASGGVTLRSRYVYAGGTLERGGSVFAPLVEVQDQSGKLTYVNTHRERFVPSDPPTGNDKAAKTTRVLDLKSGRRQFTKVTE